MSIKILNNFLNWKPLLNKIIIDKDLANTIHKKGYAILPLLNDVQIETLKEVYRKHHLLNSKEGGMFFSSFSKDLNYRYQIHQTIADTLKPLFDSYFKDYKNIFNTFIVKTSGSESEFYVHQDTTILEEFEFSPLSIWIPLQETNETNGAMNLIEKTHWFFSPHRATGVPYPFDDFVDTVRSYLKPIYMKTGEVLIFDPRIIHNSAPNTSGKERVAIACGLFPNGANFTTCFKDSSVENAPMEFYKHADDYPLKNSSFLYNANSKPTGIKLNQVDHHFPKMLATEFEALCKLNNINRVADLKSDSVISCNMIAEPNTLNSSAETKERTSWRQWLKELIRS